MELTTTGDVQVISINLIIKFLSLVHLNTMIGLQSQAFAYSDSSDDLIRYLDVVPNESDEESIMDSSIRKDSSASDRGLVKRCWIITHPTSNVFLSSAEIIQLYKHSCESKNCFCIILSPRSAPLSPF